MSNNIFLIEEHDEALKIWRKGKIKNLDLVHIDAHMDFGFYYAKPIKKVVNEARTLKELKRGLEHSIAFTRYEKNFDKQTNIGNYIYPAIEEGIVRDFYWVIPGKEEEFRRSVKFIKKIFKNLLKEARERVELKEKDGIIIANFYNRRLVVCILEKLPVFQKEVMLDIDTDFLVIDSLLNANNTDKIGKRRPWILPNELVAILKQKIKQPEIITIAYSVNGGYTPIRYKHFGDEIAYHFSPREFWGQYQKNYQAAKYFNLFCSDTKSDYYKKAIELNPTYRVADNNYGPLYLSLRKFSLADEEFSKVFKADPKNPGCLLGLGNLTLEKRDFKTAKRYFSLGISYLNGDPLGYFKNVRAILLLGLARAEFGLKNFRKAKDLLIRHTAKEPLEPFSYYLLGRIFEKEKDFYNAAIFYKSSIKLGFSVIEPLYRLLRISCHVQEKEDMIRYIITKYQKFKQEFINMKNLSFKRSKKIKGIKNIEKKMVVLEEKIMKGG